MIDRETLLRLFANVSQNTAVNVQNVTVDEVGSIGSQEYRRSHQIFWFAPASSRCFGNDEAVERMTFNTQRSGLRRFDCYCQQSAQ